MLWILQEMMAALGSAPREVQRAFRPIIEATLDNVARTSPTDALSGPVARGGVATVAEHFAAVSVTTPELLPYFAAMTRETVRLALAKGSINGDRATQFEDVILAHTRVSSQPGDHP